MTGSASVAIALLAGVACGGSNGSDGRGQDGAASVPATAAATEPTHDAPEEMPDAAVETADTTPTDQREADPLLVIAAARGDLAEVTTQLDAGADPNVARESDGWTPLLFAAQDGYTAVAAALLDAGAAADRGTDDGWTALMIASQNGHEDTVAALLERGANARVGRSTNWTALHSAALRDHVGIVGQLIRAGAPLNAAENGFTPITIAAQEGHDAVITVLLDGGAAIDGSPNAGPTPVYLAAQNDHVTAAELLLARGADPDDGGTEGPPVVIAGARSNDGVVVVLSAAGANLDSARVDGFTALHWAAYNDDAELTEQLLDLGASPGVLDDDDRTPLDIAVLRDSDASAAELRA